MSFRLFESLLVFPNKLQQSPVDLLCVCPSYAVRPTLYHQQAGSLDQLGGPESRGSDGQNPVRIAVNDQRGHVDATQVVAEVLMPCWYAGEAGRGRGAGCDVPAGLHRLFADALAEQEVGVVEILEEIGEERVTVRDDRFLDPLEH